jgi:phosphinothricin acetyltransferase
MEQPHLIRNADPARDGAGCAAVYAPAITDSAASFEERPPSPEELERRIKQTAQTHPWLVADEGEEVVGFVESFGFRAVGVYRRIGFKRGN